MKKLSLFFLFFSACLLGFVSMSSAEDTFAPQVTTFSITPTTINTESSDQILTLSITLTDDLSGVCISGDCGANFYGSPTQLRFKPASGGTQMVDFWDFTRTSGDNLNGTYTATATIPKGSAAGAWEVESFLLVDQLGNMIYENKTDLEALFGAASTKVQNIASLEDVTAPQVTAFSITPTTMNTESSDQILTLSITLTDDLSGVCISGDCGSYYSSSPSQLRIKPLIGTQMVDFWDFTRTSGDNLNGTYTATVTIPAHAKEGVWEVQYLFLVDQLGNSSSFNLNDLYTRFGGESMTVANIAQASSVEIEDQWNFSSDTASVAFDINTIVTKTEGGNFAFYEMVNQEVNVGDLPGATPNASAVKILKFGIPSIGLEFSKPVNITLQVGNQYDGDNLKIMSLTEGESVWVEENNCTVTNGVCSFAVTHASYFSATQDSPGDINLDGSVDLSDAIAALQVIAGIVPVGTVSKTADVNSDGRIGIAEALYAIQKKSAEVALSGRIELEEERQISSLGEAKLLSLSAESNGAPTATSRQLRDADEIWLAKLNVHVLNSGDAISGFFPLTKTIVPIEDDGSFNISASVLGDADVLILADTDATEQKDTIVGLIGIPDSDYLLESVPVGDLDQSLNLGIISLLNGKWRSQTALSQAANSFKSYSYGQLGEMAVIDDMVQSVINSYINYDENSGQLFGTEISITAMCGGLSADSYTDASEFVNKSGYAPHFRTNLGEDQIYYLFPPYESNAGENTFGPDIPITMGTSPDGESYYTYFSGEYVDTPAVPEKGYWQLKDDAGDLIAEADLSFLSAYGGSGHPVLIPSIRPNVSVETGAIESFDTKWYAFKNGHLEEIADEQILSRFIKSYFFQTSVQDPDSGSESFPGNLDNTPVPWTIAMASLLQEESYIKVIVYLYGSSFEFYFEEN